MKLRFFSLWVALFVVTTAVQGQSAEATAQKENCPAGTVYSDNGWFVSLGAGTLVYFGDHNKQMKLGQRLSPAMDVAVGKWFAPGIGARLMYSGLSAKGVTQNLSHSDGEVYDAGKGLYKQNFGFAHFHADALVNLPDVLLGYDKSRVYAISPYAGLGWMTTGERPHADVVSFSLGVLGTYKLLPQLDMTFDVRTTVINDRMDGETGGRGEEGILSLTLGVAYKLPF